MPAVFIFKNSCGVHDFLFIINFSFILQMIVIQMIVKLQKYF